MKYMKIIILLTFFNNIFSNDLSLCGTIGTPDDIISNIKLYRENYPENMNPNREIHWVPVQFHIVQRNDGSGGLNEIVLSGIIDDLNMDYINANIHFYQHSPVDYILDSEYYNTDGDIEINELKSINGVDNVVDIYSVGSLSTESGALCGISSFTWFGIQGIIVANGCFDRFTVNHEMGHYFNLFHPHEDASGDEFVDGNGCEYRGDGICDTPADPNLSLAGMVNACNYVGNATDPNGQAYDDCQGYELCEYFNGPDVGNIMSYAPDGCVNHFTDEQYIKAENILLSERPNYIMFPNYVEFNLEGMDVLDVVGDGDLVINPHEKIELTVNLNIDESWPISADEIILTLSSSESNIDIQFDQLYVESLSSGESFTNSELPFIIQFSSNIELGDYLFNLNLSYVADNGNNYESNFDIDLNVSLNQAGFPFSTGATVKSSPVVIDIDNDGTNEIIFGSHSGNLNICNVDMENCISYATESQIWGSPAIADIDLDGELEIVFGAVDNNIYILNSLGELEYSYDTGQFFVGTPAIGNIDNDPELEIIIGGFSSSSKLFAFNHDLTHVENFPVEINEKIKEGVALADIDFDNRNEIFFGTESDNFYRVNSDGSIFNNMPLFSADDKITFSPVVIKQSSSDFLVIFGSDDGYLYGISADGSLNFSYSTGDKIKSSASILNMNGVGFIAFGSEDGFLYVIDFEGNDSNGYPVYVGEAIEYSPVIADINNDGVPDIIVVGENSVRFYTVEGQIVASPFELTQTITGNPIVSDLDLDGDLEVFIGTNYNLSGFDKKYSGSIQNYWSMYRGNFFRNGFIDLSTLSSGYSKIDITKDLENPYPNPFNNKISIPINIDKIGSYEMAIYNIKGECLIKEKYIFNSIGSSYIVFDFTSFASGTYFIKKSGIKNSKLNKIILLK